MTLRQATKTVEAYAVLARTDRRIFVCWDESDDLCECQSEPGGFELALYGPNLSKRELLANDWTVIGSVSTLGG
jgi:hypothetical protein